MRRSREMLGAVSVAVAASWASACRDAPAPYDPGEPPAPEAVRRITWDQRDDRAPVWTADGERIVYVRGNVLSAFSDLPTLLEIPDAGGTRTLLFPDLQSEEGLGGRPLTAPAVDPRSTRLMFVQRFQLVPPAGCEEAGWQCLSVTDTTPPPSLQLEALALRIRSPGDAGELGDGPGLEFELAGRTQDPAAVNPPEFQPVVGREIVDYYPAHRLLAEDGSLFFRPAWHPAADEIVFSNARELQRWVVGSASSSPIPGTTDGITPAWSPDGQWIAFVRLERTRDTNSLCANMRIQLEPPGPPIPTCVQETRDYGLGRAFVEVVRPDGTDGRVIGEGFEPAWTPDGAHLYVRNAGGIRRLPLGGGAAELLPDSEGGREPSVSPDGSQVAFARASGSGSPHDIWVVPALP